MATLIGRLMDGALWGVLSQGGVGLLSIAISAILARSMSVEELGFFFLVIPLIRFFAIIAGFGIPEGIQKLVGIAADCGRWNDVRDIVGKIFGLFVISSMLSGLVFIAIWPVLEVNVFTDSLSLSAGLIIFAIIVLRAIEQIGAAFLRSVHRIRLGMFFVGTPREFLFAVVLFAVWGTVGKLPIEEVFQAYLGISVVIAIALLLLIVRFISARAGKAEASVNNISFPDCATLCFPMMLHTASAVLFLSVDIWVLGFFRTAEEVSLYGASLRLITLIPFSLYVLNMVLPSMVAVLFKKRDIRKLNLLMRTAAAWSFLVGGVVAVIFMAFGGPILALVFGADFENGWAVLAILALGQGINAACGSPGVVLQMTGFHKLLMKITMATAILNLAANLIVVDAYGSIGVASVTAASLIVQNAAMTWFAFRLTGVMTLPHPRMLRLRFLRRLITR